MAIEHKDITDAERHPPKGASTAVAGQVPVSDGAGEVVWGNPEPKDADTAAEFEMYISDGAGSGEWKLPSRMGWVNYEDTATTGVPIVLTPIDTFIQMTNNTLGVRTNTAFELGGTTDLWNASTDELDFSSLSIGDVVSIRTDMLVTTTGANHGIQVIYRFGIGGFQFDLTLDDLTFKTAGVHTLLRTINIFLADSNIVDNPGQIMVLSDTGTTASVVVNGWFIEVVTRGDL